VIASQFWERLRLDNSKGTTMSATQNSPIDIGIRISDAIASDSDCVRRMMIEMIGDRPHAATGTLKSFLLECTKLELAKLTLAVFEQLATEVAKMELELANAEFQRCIVAAIATVGETEVEFSYDINDDEYLTERVKDLMSQPAGDWIDVCGSISVLIEKLSANFCTI
jgi:hypothetical protein